LERIKKEVIGMKTDHEARAKSLNEEKKLRKEIEVKLEKSSKAFKEECDKSNKFETKVEELKDTVRDLEF